MLFQSATYLLFLPISVICYWLLPRSWRVHFLLVASYLFYASWSVPYALMMFALVVVNWWAAALAIRSERLRSTIVITAVVFDLAVLGAFKYLDFFSQNAAAVASWATSATVTFPLLAPVLPLGISFFTFEFIHFLVDVRRGDLPQCRFSQFHVFSAFFPTQIAGPIKRFQDFLPQIDRIDRLTSDLVSRALPLIARGLFKKLALADNLAPIANAGFARAGAPAALDAWVVVTAFAFQIYFDFSGYTDIARGSALLLGFDIPINFHDPYFARNVSDFWHRWHISLSRWLRDYVFIPLGGSRGGRLRTARNLLITMLLGGLWHGAAWRFVVWGAYWGVLLVGYHQWRLRTRDRAAQPTGLKDAVNIALTFVVSLVGWCFFRAPVRQAVAMISAMFGIRTGARAVPMASVLAVVLVAVAYYATVIIRTRLAERIDRIPSAVRGLSYAALVVVAVLGAPPAYQPFVYFQF